MLTKGQKIKFVGNEQLVGSWEVVTITNGAVKVQSLDNAWLAVIIRDINEVNYVELEPVCRQGGVYLASCNGSALMKQFVALNNVYSGGSLLFIELYKLECDDVKEACYQYEAQDVETLNANDWSFDEIGFIDIKRLTEI